MRLIWFAAGVCIGLASCAGNYPPELLPIDSQTAYVGSRLEIKLVASDPDGDRVTYSFACPTLSDLAQRARLARIGSEAAFTWTPLANDVGTHQIDFLATDGIATDIEPVIVTVKASTGPDTAPQFRKPLGDGTTLDMKTEHCKEIDVLVEDPDSVDVTISQEPPIPGSTLTTTAPAEAKFSWCPTPAQASQPRFVLRLVADDHDNPPVRRPDYIILILSDLPPVCPGNPPVIVHVPPAATTTADDILLSATVTDDRGLKGPPTVYYATTAPADPVNLDYGALAQLATTETPPGSRVYQTQLPNPTKGLSAGESRTVYYVLVAEDNDDPAGTCDHRARLPEKTLFEIKVTRPAQTPSCTKTSQCKPGEVCDGKACVSDGCTPVDTNGDKLYWEQSTCPVKHFCPAKGPTPAPSHCAELCVSDADCQLPGYACKIFDTKPGCGLTGTKNVGTSCSSFTECKGAAMCLSWKGGYCAMSDCDSSGFWGDPCPSGSACIPVTDVRFPTTLFHFLCLKVCTSAANCRASEGYSCKLEMDDTDGYQQVCEL